MADARIYEEIAARTGGNIYIGVVGPVRTGKSTFIKRFMETLVLPQMTDVYQLERARDEMPQSGSGRTIMTAEPKFVPETAAEIELGGSAHCSIRLVDSVGFMVRGAVGNLEDGAERTVMTPWYDEEIPISQAAEEGTYRVISEHSTIGVLVTTDGSVCGIPREEYEAPEARAAEELEKAGKPYVILLNCAEPGSEEAAALAAELRERFGHSCIPVNCARLEAEQIQEILQRILFEFPVRSFRVYLPPWVDALAADDEIKTGLFRTIASYAADAKCIGEAAATISRLAEHDAVSAAVVRELSLGTGDLTIGVELLPQVYYQTIRRESGFPIRNDCDLMRLLQEISSLTGEYERVHAALDAVREKGYAIVMPTMEEMSLEEPQIVRQGGRYGVRLKASAPSIHMMMANIETEVSPAIGGESASEDVINFLLQGYDGDMSRIWESNIFGKSLNDIAAEGLTNKIRAMPEDVQAKLRTTVQRIVNEGSGGIICILL